MCGDWDGSGSAAVLDLEQQRVVEHLEGNSEGRLRVHHGVGGEFAHDHGDVVDEVCVSPRALRWSRTKSRAIEALTG